MDYTRLVTKRGQYKYSVNICFDLRDEERITGFIPNGFIDDPAADQKAELFIKAQMVGQHKGDNEYQYIYDKANDI